MHTASIMPDKPKLPGVLEHINKVLPRDPPSPFTVPLPHQSVLLKVQLGLRKGTMLDQELSELLSSDIYTHHRPKTCCVRQQHGNNPSLALLLSDTTSVLPQRLCKVPL